MSTELIPYRDVVELADVVVRSRMFPGISTPEAALTLMMLCQSEGLHPMQAMMRYHIIQGRPAMKADAMLAEFMRRGGTVDWIEWTNEACEAIFKSKGVPNGVNVRWTLQDAKRAGVTGNPTWTKYPRQMLKARVASDGVRMCDPAVNQGRYTPEEVQDIVSEEEPTRRLADAEIVPPEPSQEPEEVSAAGEAREGVASGETPEPDPQPDQDAAGRKLAAMLKQTAGTECSSCGSHMVVKLDGKGEPYAQCVLWHDERAAAKTDEEREAIAARFKGHDFKRLKKEKK